MKPAMATRKPSDSDVDLKTCTSYCLHKSQQTFLEGAGSKVIDYTEHKLRRFADSVKDEQQKRVIRELIIEYVAGLVAVAWSRGKPTYIRVTKAA